MPCQNSFRISADIAIDLYTENDVIVFEVVSIFGA